jgi:hypothetical protein
LQFISHYLGNGEFLPHSKIIHWLEKYGCELVTRQEKICEDTLFVVAGFDEEQFNMVSPNQFSYTFLYKALRRKDHLGDFGIGRKLWEIIAYFPSIVRVRVTLRLAVYRQTVRFGAEHPETHGQIFVFQWNTCGHCPYVTSSLTRGWVCRLKLLLALSSAFILMSESRRTHDHILLSQIRDSPNLEPRSPYLYPPGTG